ncbi:hypothetical protein [Sporolactobacillus pectinivorans]|uniref:hypothetical protein n=1 Tax=Sporolactobacillus pectinivorans TaxID=1591408 RepID=UPI000C256DCC|nr:hypothetical protein [Sporolactobacillus pectinivorans]
MQHLVDARGLSIKEINNKIDFLILETDQLENKVTRRIEDLIDFHCSAFRLPILHSAKKLVNLDQEIGFFKTQRPSIPDRLGEVRVLSLQKKKAVASS